MSKKLIKDKQKQIALLTQDINTLQAAVEEVNEEIYNANIGRCFVVVTSWAKEIYPIYRTIHKITGVSKNNNGGFSYEIDAFYVRKGNTYVQIFTKFEDVPTDDYKIEDYAEISVKVHTQLKNYYNKWLVDFATGFDQLITKQILNKDIADQPIILRPFNNE